jgi:hypothetical protein
MDSSLFQRGVYSLCKIYVREDSLHLNFGKETRVKEEAGDGKGKRIDMRQRKRQGNKISIFGIESQISIVFVSMHR